MQRANKIYLRFENERIDSNVCTINIRISYVHAARKLLFFIDKQAWRSQRYEPGAKIVMRRERESKREKKADGSVVEASDLAAATRSLIFHRKNRRS